MKKKEKDLYKNENDKISTERERKRTIYLLHEIVMCKYIHAYTFVCIQNEKKKIKTIKNYLFILICKRQRCRFYSNMYERKKNKKQIFILQMKM